ncbi:hypothetical protein C8Q76DRAFT_291272 [Earliella scabrosa]|nr:hypothetical protein C8Q76DRAFT_291272 [Earliella scabrosa]
MEPAPQMIVTASPSSGAGGIHISASRAQAVHARKLGCGCNVVGVPAPTGTTTKNKNGTLVCELPTMGVYTLPPVTDATTPEYKGPGLVPASPPYRSPPPPARASHYAIPQPVATDTSNNTLLDIVPTSEDPEMARASFGQLWGGRASSSTSSSDEDRLPSDYEDELSELSELSDSDYTPETEDEASESDDKCLEDREFKLRQNVLVKPRGSREWYKGVVVKIREPSLREKRRGTLYIVVFRRYRTNIRDSFSAAEGNIRRDTPRTRAL